MADLFDYMRWRGDLPFDRDGLNDIDNLILCRVSYLPFDGIVSGELRSKSTLGEAAKAFLALPDAEKRVCMDADMKFCAALAECPRFAALPVLGYENIVDPVRELQFSAMIFALEPELHFVAFRGTDNTLVGWKEDFNMSFTTPVPAQLEAARYLERAAWGLKGRLICAGHSKGGNLAVYAAAFAAPSVRKRVERIYTNDSPGFERSVLLTDGYLDISERIRSFVPQSSVVGMLLEHEEDYTVVKSNQLSLWQHDLYSWEVLGREFVSLSRVTNSAKFIDGTLKDWLSAMNREQREKFIDGIFSLLDQTGAPTFNELNENLAGSLLAIAKSAAGMDEETRSNILFGLGRLIRSAKENFGGMLPKFPVKKE
ncbi:MAG: Mbeg1-like protein [Candidatus Heteroscillospira sp.]|jgi:hypothetical protein